jgi:hypothetical protein
VTIGCAGCGNQYVVSDPRDLHLEQDAVVWHWLCRTAIPCPAVAELVQCSVRTVNSPHVEGCLALIVGPAAGGEPPPPDEEPPPAFTLPPRTRRREPEGWW